MHCKVQTTEGTADPLHEQADSPDFFRYCVGKIERGLDVRRFFSRVHVGNIHMLPDEGSPSTTSQSSSHASNPTQSGRESQEVPHVVSIAIFSSTCGYSST